MYLNTMYNGRERKQEAICLGSQLGLGLLSRSFRPTACRGDPLISQNKGGTEKNFFVNDGRRFEANTETTRCSQKNFVNKWKLLSCKEAKKRQRTQDIGKCLW
jgi:hypothetical protein